MCSSCIYHKAWARPCHTGCSGVSRSRSCDNCCWIADFPRKQCRDTSRNPHTCHKHWRQPLDPEIQTYLKYLWMWSWLTPPIPQMIIVEDTIFWQKKKNHWVSWQVCLFTRPNQKKRTKERKNLEQGLRIWEFNNWMISRYLDLPSIEMQLSRWNGNLIWN